MTMYDELVKQLRDNAEFLVKASSGCLSNSFADTMKQAADAIEELEAIREEQKAQIIAMAAEDKPRWIPVTERLPEQGKRYLVIRFDEVTKTQFIDILWHDAHDLWWNRLYKGQYNVTHWMRLPEPPKEE